MMPLKMKYTHWLRFVWPMMVFLLVFGGIMQRCHDQAGRADEHA